MTRSIDFYGLFYFMKLFVKSIFFAFVWRLFCSSVFAIDFTRDFVAPLLTGDSSVYGDLINKVDKDKSFLENVSEIFYPPVLGESSWDISWWWAIWDMIRTVWVGILTLLLIRAWARLVLFGGSDEDRAKSLKNLLYIWYGIALFFWATWILGTLLDIWDFNGLVDPTEWVVNQLENSVVLQVIGFLKALAFFMAITFVLWYGFRMVTALDSEEKATAARKWLTNVVIALVLIKVIDFIYYMVQAWDVKSEVFSAMTAGVSFLSFLFGGAIFLIILYIWFLYLTSAGQEDRITKAKTLLRNVFLAALVVFLFLLIVYQIFADITL